MLSHFLRHKYDAGSHENYLQHGDASMKDMDPASEKGPSSNVPKVDNLRWFFLQDNTKLYKYQAHKGNIKIQVKGFSNKLAQQKSFFRSKNMPRTRLTFRGQSLQNIFYSMQSTRVHSPLKIKLKWRFIAQKLMLQHHFQIHWKFVVAIINYLKFVLRMPCYSSEWTHENQNENTMTLCTDYRCLNYLLFP